jgi:ADP-heptose:LPS heptosyltransferase
MTDLSNDLADFGETAALMQNLDLVITVDTSMGHLAGALGKPVWILIPKAADWRWLLEREDSPWYPSARLFRQQKPGAWDEPMSRLRTALAAYLNQAHAAVETSAAT